MRIYYKSEAARDYAFKELCLLSSEMASIASEAKSTLSGNPEDGRCYMKNVDATEETKAP